MTHPYRILLDPTGDEGGAPAAAPPAPAQRTPAEPQGDPAEGWKTLLAKMNNDATKVAEKLYDENRSLRVKLRDARGKAKPDDGLVLSGDEAKAWSEYQAIGKAADLKQALTERDQLKAELGGIRKAGLHKQAAEAHGYRATVLSRLLDQDALDLEVKEEQQGGKPAQVAYVKHKDDQGKDVSTRLPDYAQKHWAEFLPSLGNKETPAPSLGTPVRALPAAPRPNDGERKSLYGGRSPL